MTNKTTPAHQRALSRLKIEREWRKELEKQLAKCSAEREQRLNHERTQFRALLEDGKAKTSSVQEKLTEMHQRYRNLDDRHAKAMILLATIVMHNGGVMAIRPPIAKQHPVVHTATDEKLNAVILSI
jgi:hypothetical protein